MTRTSRAARLLADALEDPNGTDLLGTIKKALVLIAPPTRTRKKKDPLRAERRLHVRDLDRMCREIVFARDDSRCRNCGCREGLLDWAHILSRRHPKTRHDPLNSMVLCRACHMRFHDQPVAGAQIIEGAIGREGYELLKARARGPGKTNLGLTRLHLIQEGKRYGLKLGGV